MASPSPTQPEGAAWQEQVQSILGRKLTSIEAVGGIYCSICHSTFGNKKDYDTHYVDHNIGDADIGYTCVVCKKQFAGYPSFRNHCYLAHVTKDKHKCGYCSKSFSKQSVLTQHIDAMHTYKCGSCSLQFSSKKELHTHQIHHEKEKPPYKCLECKETIDSIDMCEFHIDEHCISVYSCPICNESSNNKVDVAKHLTKHFGEVLTDEEITASKIGEDCSVDILGGVLCSYCDELFKSRIEIDTHFATEHSDKEPVYSCNICGKQYDKYHAFGNHCYYHISKDRFECTDCGKTFPRLSLLVMHTEAFHSSDSGAKPYRCGECGHGFMSPNRLCRHTRVVHETSAMRCQDDGCSMTFESLKELLLHRRSHRSGRQPWCGACGLALSSRAACERHLDVHRARRYSCAVCGRAYREKYLMLKHIPQHFEAVLHVCKVCGKVFSRRHRLVAHSKTHSNLRAYKCTYCNKGFMKASQMEQHLNIHTGFRPYKCTVCPKTFASHPNWYKHLRRVHNIDKEGIKIAKDKQVNNTITAIEPPPATVNDNSNSQLQESGNEWKSSEISLEAYIFAESDDSTIDSIDPIVIEKDWSIVTDNSIIDNSLQYTDMLPVNGTTFNFEEEAPCAPAAAAQSAVPREYGPEFNVCTQQLAAGGACIDLDDHYLPHIDPLLTIKPRDSADRDDSADFPDFADFPDIGDYSAYGSAQPAWEPLITKVYDTDLNRLSIMNTDIY